jgi:hypothetical protein
MNKLGLSKITVFWDVTPRSPIDRCPLFGGKYCFCIQGRKVLFYPGDGSSTFILNFCNDPSDYTVSFQKTVIFQSSPNESQISHKFREVICKLLPLKDPGVTEEDHLYISSTAKIQNDVTEHLETDSTDVMSRCIA